MRRFAGDLPDDAWFGQQAVYRISMGNFVSWLGRCWASSCAGRRHSVAPQPQALGKYTTAFCRWCDLGSTGADACSSLWPTLQVLFGTLAVVMFDVKYKSDRRDAALHHGEARSRVAAL